MGFNSAFKGFKYSYNNVITVFIRDRLFVLFMCVRLLMLLLGKVCS